MTTVKEIEAAVEHLPPKDLSQFRTWFETFEAAAWDRQFEGDVNCGRLDLLVNEARTEYKAGKTTSKWPNPPSAKEFLQNHGQQNHFSASADMPNVSQPSRLPCL